MIDDKQLEAACEEVDKLTLPTPSQIIIDEITCALVKLNKDNLALKTALAELAEENSELKATTHRFDVTYLTLSAIIIILLVL